MKQNTKFWAQVASAIYHSFKMSTGLNSKQEERGIPLLERIGMKPDVEYFMIKMI